jgi:hypothetical protein
MANKSNTSRRTFLTQSLSAAGMFFIPWDLLKTENMGNVNLLEKGVLFSKDDIPRIKNNTQLPLFKDFWQSAVNADLKADIKFLKEELNIHRHFQHLIKADDILRRSALVSLLENNKAHEDVAKLAIEKIHSFEDWDYIIEGGKEMLAFQCAPDALISFVLAYDWMKEKLSTADKDDMLKAIAKKGAQPCYLTLYGMKYPEKVKGWSFDPREDYRNNVDLSKWPVILNRTNLKMVPISGLIIGALALEGKYPESKKWLELGIDSMKDFATMWGKDGVYLEGFGYSGYSTKHMILSVDVLNRAKKANYSNIINFKGYSKFILQMFSPFKNNPFGAINFGDNAFSIESPLLLWIAREFKDGIAQYTFEKFPCRINAYALAWYDGSVKPKDPSPDLMDVKFSNDWVVSRNGWTENDTVVGFRSGGPGNHEHADRNSIILNAFGERLLHDPLGAAYQAVEKHWLLRQTEAHTAVLIDGKGHQYHDGRDGTNSSQASAKVTQYKPGKKMTVVTSDATQAYKLVNQDVKKIQRTIALIKPDIFIIIDELEKLKDESKLQVRFQAYNVDNKAVLKTSNDAKTFQIVRPSAKLLASIWSSVKINITDGKLDVPADKGIFPYIEVSNDQSKECIMVTVCSVIPENQKEEPEITINASTTGYEIIVKSLGKENRINIIMGKEYPNVKLIS